MTCISICLSVYLTTSTSTGTPTSVSGKNISSSPADTTWGAVTATAPGTPPGVMKYSNIDNCKLAIASEGEGEGEGEEDYLLKSKVNENDPEFHHDPVPEIVWVLLREMHRPQLHILLLSVKLLASLRAGLDSNSDCDSDHSPGPSKGPSLGPCDHSPGPSKPTSSSGGSSSAGSKQIGLGLASVGSPGGGRSDSWKEREKVSLCLCLSLRFKGLSFSLYCWSLSFM